MLAKLKTYASVHLQAAVASLQFFRRKPVGSLMTLIVIAITLTLPAIFWVFTDNLKQVTNAWQTGGHISLYLKSTDKNVEPSEVLKKVEDTPGVGQASLKLPAQGLAELQAQEGMHDIMRYLPENPLPAVIEVLPSVDVESPAKLDLLYQNLKMIPGVEQAKLDIQWIKRLHAILGFSGRISKALMILLATAVIVIIGNTLRLAIQSRQEEIQVLKLIGATDAYIVRPFLYSGLWYGILGALLAVLLVNLFLISLAKAAQLLVQAYQIHYPTAGLSLRQMGLLVMAAAVLGWLGARLSVKRQLSSIEPYN